MMESISQRKQLTFKMMSFVFQELSKGMEAQFCITTETLKLIQVSGGLVVAM